MVCGIASRGSSALLKSEAASACRPITWNGSPKILIVLPIGSRPGNSDSASLSLMTATRAAAAYSTGVKLRPAMMSPPFTWIQVGLMPAMATLVRFTPSKLTGPLVYSPMLTSRTAGSCRISSASSVVIQGIRRHGRQLVRAVRDVEPAAEVPLDEERLGPGRLEDPGDAAVDAR